MLKKLKALYSFKESLSMSDLGVVFILLIPIRMGIIKACKTINHNVLDLKNALGDLSGTSAILDYIQQYSPWILLEIVLFCIFAYVTASTIVCRLRHQRFSVWWSVPLVIVDLFFLRYCWVLVALLKGKKQNNSPLFVYLQKDDAAELRRLIAEGMDVNTEDDEEGEMPLMLASRYAAPACVRVLIEAGANVNYRDEVGDTPLHKACLWAALNNGRPAAEVVQLLLRAGADASVKNKSNKTPADYAKLCYRGKFCLALLNGELPLDAPIPKFTVEDGVTVESVREELNRKAVLFRSTLAPDNHDWQGSCLGCVCRQLPGETAPLNAEGEPLMPLATLFLKDLPWVPEELKGIALITVFGPKPDDIYDYEPEELAKGFVIRTYESLDGLESCEYLTTDFTPCTLTPEFVQNDQIQALGQLTDSALRYKIDMLEEALGIDYDKDIKQTQYESHKIGGYPNYAQDNPDDMPERFRYVFQICSELDANLCIGDCGSIFFYYDPQAKEWNVYWDCY